MGKNHGGLDAQRDRIALLAYTFGIIRLAILALALAGLVMALGTGLADLLGCFPLFLRSMGLRDRFEALQVEGSPPGG
jgi:hypothetical protein